MQSKMQSHQSELIKNVQDTEKRLELAIEDVNE
jgi:hypothetical protein